MSSGSDAAKTEIALLRSKVPYYKWVVEVEKTLGDAASTNEKATKIGNFYLADRFVSVVVFFFRVAALLQRCNFIHEVTTWSIVGLCVQPEGAMRSGTFPRQRGC